MLQGLRWRRFFLSFLLALVLALVLALPLAANRETRLRCCAARGAGMPRWFRCTPFDAMLDGQDPKLNRPAL
jgi:hypothetical protein